MYSDTCCVAVKHTYIMGIKNKLSCRNIQFWLEKGHSLEESEHLIKTRTPGSYEYFRFYKNLPEEEAHLKVKEYRKRIAVTLDNMIWRYGEEDGRRRWDSYRNKQAVTNSFEYKRDKYGWTEDDFDKYNNSRAVTLENLIKKYGLETGTEMFEKYRKRQAYAGCKLEYFIEKYGEIDGLEKYKQINKLKSNSIDNYLLRYDGDYELAICAWESANLNKFKNSSKFKSAIANELFDNLYEFLIKKGFQTIYYANNIGEWYLYDNLQKRIYFYDFFVKDIGKLIEFNGDYWHGNPRIYNENDIIKYPNNVDKIAKDVWDADKIKLDVIAKYPIIKEYLIIWEMDYRNNKEQIIEECKNFLMK